MKYQKKRVVARPRGHKTLKLSPKGEDGQILEKEEDFEIEETKFNHIPMRNSTSHDFKDEIMHRRTMLESIKEIDEEQVHALLYETPSEDSSTEYELTEPDGTPSTRLQNHNIVEQINRLNSYQTNIETRTPRTIVNETYVLDLIEADKKFSFSIPSIPL